MALLLVRFFRKALLLVLLLYDLSRLVFDYVQDFDQLVEFDDSDPVSIVEFNLSYPLLQDWRESLHFVFLRECPDAKAYDKGSHSGR